jgi:hypothetical protein
LAYERIKAEHAGAKNGGGAWMTRAEAKQTAKRRRGQTDKQATSPETHRGEVPVDMTAKEKLLKEAPRWSEHDAQVALRAVEREHNGETEQKADAWGDLDEFSARASTPTLRRLDEQEAAAGFSWESHGKS